MIDSADGLDRRTVLKQVGAATAGVAGLATSTASATDCCYDFCVGDYVELATTTYVYDSCSEACDGVSDEESFPARYDSCGKIVDMCTDYCGGSDCFVKVDWTDRDYSNGWYDVVFLDPKTCGGLC